LTNKNFWGCAAPALTPVIIRPHRVLPVCIPVQQMKPQLLWTVVRCALLELSQEGPSMDNRWGDCPLSKALTGCLITRVTSDAWSYWLILRISW